MHIQENTQQHLILKDSPWWGLAVGLVVAGFCFLLEPAEMTASPILNKLILVFVGIAFLAGFTLAMRKTTIHFDRTAGTISRISAPLLPLNTFRLFGLRSETRAIKPVLFAYLEMQRKSSHSAVSRYSLALATGEIPDDILGGKSSMVFAPEMDKVRWLVGFNIGMKKTKANEIANTVNQWLGTNTRHNIV